MQVGNTCKVYGAAEHTLKGCNGLGKAWIFHNIELVLKRYPLKIKCVPNYLIAKEKFDNTKNSNFSC